jgi:hypothetical protein
MMSGTVVEIQGCMATSAAITHDVMATANQIRGAKLKSPACRRLPRACRHRRGADNYNHLFEAPTIFYAVALAIVAGIADPFYAACAWASLGCRIMHSLVQATINRVQLRAALYGLSWIPLAVMIVRPILTL